MTIKGTLDSLTKLADKIDSILGKVKWYGIALTFLLGASHWKACNDRDKYEKAFNQVKSK